MEVSKVTLVDLLDIWITAEHLPIVDEREARL